MMKPLNALLYLNSFKVCTFKYLIDLIMKQQQNSNKKQQLQQQKTVKRTKMIFPELY